MSNICLVVLIGIPGAGKSDLCTFLCQRLSSDTVQVFHVSYDEYAKEFKQCEYQELRSNVFTKVDTLLCSLIENNHNKSCFIFIDDNMYYRSMRRSYFQLAKKYCIGFCQLYVSCNINTALSRNNERKIGMIPNDIIYDMFEKLEPPSKNNLWEKYSLEINSESKYNENDLENINLILQEAIQNPVKIIPENVDVNVHSPSLIHEVDLILRKLVSQKLRDTKKQTENKESVEHLSKKLAKRKKGILNNLKNKILFLNYKNQCHLEELLKKLLIE